MDTSKITMYRIDPGEGLKMEYKNEPGRAVFNADTIEATGDDFWSVMVAAQRRGISFTDYIWQCAVEKARSEV